MAFPANRARPGMRRRPVVLEGVVSSGLVALAAALVVAVAAGLAWRAANGRRRPARTAGLTRAGRTEVAMTAGAGAADEAGMTTGAGMTTEAGPTPGSAAPANPPSSRVSAADLGQPLGERATLLQFSSAFCAPCRATRVILADVAGRVPGIAHVEVDAESHLDLVRALGVLRTPTVFVLGADGAISARASGQPRKADVIGALGAVLPAGSSYSPGLETG
jgi:thiol-disulfide isomerase/thioredoxin